MKACLSHSLAIPPQLKEVGTWVATFEKKRGYPPYVCEKCGYLIFEKTPLPIELRNLKGSIRNTEMEKYLVEDYLSA